MPGGGRLNFSIKNRVKIILDMMPRRVLSKSFTSRCSVHRSMMEKYVHEATRRVPRVNHGATIRERGGGHDQREGEREGGFILPVRS